MHARAKVVIVGGGIAGHKIAFRLQDLAAVTLIDPKDFFEIPMAAPRQLVAPGELASIIAYSEFLPRARVICGKAVGISERSVEIETANDRLAIDYDWLVLATGATYGDELTHARAGTAAGRLAHYRDLHSQIVAAAHIVIIGGGPVGVEIAGEISRDFPGKRLTLVEGGPRLLASTSQKPSRWAEELLRSRGVEVRLGERVDGRAVNGVIITMGGAEIACDLVLNCVGASPTTGWLKGSRIEGALDAKGHVRVEPTLQVRGTTNIFAVGDITALDEIKLGVWAGAHAGVVTSNLTRLIGVGTKSPTLKAYKPATGNQMMLVTLGRDAGVMHLPFGQFRAGWLARVLKAKSMLVPTFRKGIGVNA